MLVVNVVKMMSLVVEANVVKMTDLMVLTNVVN